MFDGLAGDYQNVAINWSGRDSNPRPPACKADALPLSYRPKCLYKLGDPTSQGRAGQARRHSPSGHSHESCRPGRQHPLTIVPIYPQLSCANRTDDSLSYSYFPTAQGIPLGHRLAALPPAPRSQRGEAFIPSCNTIRLAHTPGLG